jgi:Tol biopolymer transport system component
VRVYTLAVALAALTLAPSAHATFPGRNGEIAYVDSYGTDWIETDLYQVCADGSRERYLLRSGPTGITSGAYSPNGQWFAVNGGIDETAISIGRVDGTDSRQVTRPPRRAMDGGPTWSPKGGAIAFTRERYDNDFDLRSTAVRIYSRGRGRFLARGGGPLWSVRGQIAFTRTTGGDTDLAESWIYVMPAKGGTPRKLTAGGALDWSPDGRRLLIGSAAGEIAVISANGTGLRRLATGYGASWSPDGRRIALITPAGYAAVISPNGRGLRRLARTDGGVLFSPDSRWLAITWEDELYVVRVSGGGRHFVTLPWSDEDLFMLDWRPIPHSAVQSSPVAELANGRPRRSCR